MSQFGMGTGRRRTLRWALPTAALAVVATASTVLLAVRADADCVGSAALAREPAPAAMSPAAMSPAAMAPAAMAPAAMAPAAMAPAAMAPAAMAPAAMAPVVLAAGETRSGRATFYGADGGGNCSFEQLGPGMYVALGPSEYQTAGACGGYIDVTGPKGAVRVKVTDQCPECEPGHLDLSQEAFTRIGNITDGIIQIKYQYVTNPTVPGPLTVRVKEGANPYWFAVRIDNHGNPLTKVEVQNGSGWTALTRMIYNYWLKQDGAGAGPFTLRLTDNAGHQATVSGVKLAPMEIQKTGIAMYGAVPAGTPKPGAAAPTGTGSGGGASGASGAGGHGSTGASASGSPSASQTLPEEAVVAVRPAATAPRRCR